ncbi:MAG: acetamidase/formamidase family protein [Trueperaceae bacterium]
MQAFTMDTGIKRLLRLMRPAGSRGHATLTIMAVHTFQPRHYHNTLGSHEPVLRVASGDTIITTTVDAYGFDHAHEQVAQRGNPQTGPFYIDGAEPGDMLEVRLEKLTPNRLRGFSGQRLAPNVVDPDYVMHLPEPIGPNKWVEWHVDEEAGTATLAEPETRLGRLQLPLDPMLGCFGVAPPGRQAISTATSWVHGGNMDYRGFRAGVSAYFPVFEPGALLFVGDGHALQGDGEISGNGVEISMDVELSVRLHKEKAIRWPHGRNEEFIFTVGNARPLDQATQHATTEMLRWLEEDFGLDGLAANILLSQCVRYDLGNMFDPAYTMVCKVATRLLENTEPS